MSQASQHRRLWSQAKQIGLTDEERHELAGFITGHEGSWSTISEENAKFLADRLDGYLLVAKVLQMRPDAEVIDFPKVAQVDCNREGCEGWRRDDGLLPVINCPNAPDVASEDNEPCPLLSGVTIARFD